MSRELTKSTDTVFAGMIAGSRPAAKAQASGVYRVECVGYDGKVKWVEESHNLVVNQGLQNMVATYLDASTQTTTWYLGLITGPGPVTIDAANTLASKAWTEFPNYSGNRKAVVFGTATTADPSSIDNSASPASFGITGAGGTVAGAFLASVASGTSGILFSASNFQSPGDRAVTSGDTLNVTYTFSLDAA